MNEQKNLTTVSLLRLPTVLGRVEVSRSNWWAGVKRGRYPKPVKISQRCTAWRSTDIDALIERLSQGPAQ